MKSAVRRAVAVLVLPLVCLACGGGGGGSPTEPPPASGKRIQFTVLAISTFLQGGLLEATVSFDGREVSRVDWSRGGSACTVACGIAADVQGLAPGNHTIRFTVVRQTQATVHYTVAYSGILIDPATNQRDPVSSQPQQLRLQAGQSVTFNLRV
jgi:hypothetical protein